MGAAFANLPKGVSARNVRMPSAVMMRPVMQTIRRLRVAITTFRPVEVRSGRWRSKPASVKQRELIASRCREALVKHKLHKLWGSDVGDILYLCGMWAHAGTGLTKGSASDILDVLFNIRHVEDIDAVLRLAEGCNETRAHA